MNPTSLSIVLLALAVTANAHARSEDEELERTCKWGRFAGFEIGKPLTANSEPVYKTGSCIGDMEQRGDRGKVDGMRSRWDVCNARNNCGAWGYHNGQDKRDACIVRCITGLGWPNWHP